MARPYRMKEIEHEWGEALETLIPRLLNEHKTISAVAHILGVSDKHLFLWCQKNNVVKEFTWVKRDLVPADAQA
jgi:hypothetical protein